MRERRDPTKIRMLRTVPELAHASDRELARLTSVLDVVDVVRGQPLLREGRPWRELFFVVDGVAEVERGGTAVGDLRSGEVGGEIAVLHGTTRTADVTAASSMRLLVAGPTGVGTLLGDPVVARSLMDARDRRLQVLA